MVVGAGQRGCRSSPDAGLYKKSPGTGAALCFMGHALTENRHWLVVQGDLPHAPVGSMLRMRLPGNGRPRRAKGCAVLAAPPLPRIDPAADLGSRQEIRCGRIPRRSPPSLRHPARRQEGAAFSNRRSHNPAQRLCPVLEAPQTDRGGVWLGQDRWRHVPDRLSRRRTGAVALHPDARRRNSRLAAPVADGMSLEARDAGLLPATQAGRPMRELIPPRRTPSHWPE